MKLDLIVTVGAAGVNFFFRSFLLVIIEAELLYCVIQHGLIFVHCLVILFCLAWIY
jgi:hypothetical protein